MASFNGGAMGNSTEQRQSSSPPESRPRRRTRLVLCRPHTPARAAGVDRPRRRHDHRGRAAGHGRSRDARSRRCRPNGPRCTPQQAALKEAAAAMAATIVRPITPPPAPAPAPAPRRPRRPRRPSRRAAPPTGTGTRPCPCPRPLRPPPLPPLPRPAIPASCRRSGRPPPGAARAALAYLQAYAAKGFTLECPGYAEGREAMTCMNQAGACPGTSVIAIADPCPQAYMNEASNSLRDLGGGGHAHRPLRALPLSLSRRGRPGGPRRAPDGSERWRRRRP